MFDVLGSSLEVSCSQSDLLDCNCVSFAEVPFEDFSLSQCSSKASELMLIDQETILCRHCFHQRTLKCPIQKGYKWILAFLGAVLSRTMLSAGL